MNPRTMDNILQVHPGRETYLKDLCRLFGQPVQCFPSSVFVCGASGTGKTAVLIELLQQLYISYALVDCVEFYTTKMLFEHIINCFKEHTLSSNNNFTNAAVCDSTEDFLNALNAMNTRSSYVLVLKNFTRLHEIDASILPVLMRFQSLAPSINISCVLIGSKSKLDHIMKQGITPSIDLHCEQYSKSDLLKVLSLQIEHLRNTMIKVIEEGDPDEVLKAKRLKILKELNDDFFIGYFNLFLDTFFTVCRNVNELSYMSNTNFPIYCKPVIDEKLKTTDLRKLWKNMELPFKMAMNTIYCRVDQSQPNVSILNRKVNVSLEKKLNWILHFLQNNDGEASVVAATSTKSEVQQLELPFYTKFLLIAAYLASHNDAKLDKRLFVKHHGKQRKRLQKVRANAMVTTIKKSSSFYSKYDLIVSCPLKNRCLKSFLRKSDQNHLQSIG